MGRFWQCEVGPPKKRFETLIDQPFSLGGASPGLFLWYAGEDLFGEATGLQRLSEGVVHGTQPDGNVVKVGDVSG